MASSLPVRCARFCSSVAKPAGALIPHVATRNSLRISCNVFAHSNVTSSSSAFCSRALQEVHTRATVEQANDSISVAESGSTEPFNTWKIKMLYDGECPLCMREVNMLRERNKLYGTIKFVDISSNDYSPDENAGLNYKTVMGNIHAILYDGTVLTDIAAFKRLYEEVGLGWVYAITKYKPIAIIADAIYAVWAKYRLQITGRPPLDKVIEEREQKKKRHLREVPVEEDLVEQALFQEHGENIEDQSNDPLEEEDDVNNTIEEDGRNISIKETFNNVGIDDDEDPLDGVFDIHVLDKAQQTLH